MPPFSVCASSKAIHVLEEAGILRPLDDRKKNRTVVFHARHCESGGAAQTFTLGPGERGNHQVVGVIDHLPQESFRQGTVQGDRVPVALVHVVARRHGRMRRAQQFGPYGVAFQVERRTRVKPLGQGEELAQHLEHEHLGAEGKARLGPGFRVAMVDEGFVHG